MKVWLYPKRILLKYFSANIQSIQVVGLTEDLNSQIQERLSYLKNNNIFLPWIHPPFSLPSAMLESLDNDK